jgi:hypothetical protein
MCRRRVERRSELSAPGLLRGLLFVLAENCVRGILDAAEDRLATRLCPTLLRFCRFHVERQSQIPGADVRHKIVTKHDIVQASTRFGNCTVWFLAEGIPVTGAAFFHVSLESILPGGHLDPVLLRTPG